MATPSLERIQERSRRKKLIKGKINPYTISRKPLESAHGEADRDALKGCFNCPCVSALVTQAVPDVGGIPVGKRIRVECSLLKSRKCEGLVKPFVGTNAEECPRRHREMEKSANPTKDPEVGAEITRRRREEKRRKATSTT